MVDDREVRVNLSAKGAEYRVDILNPKADWKGDCFLSNASRSGMFLKTDQLLPKGKLFDFTVIKEKDHNILGRLYVKWTRPEANGPYLPRGVGVEVVEFFKESHLHWLEMIEQSLLCIGITDLIAPKLVSVNTDALAKDVIAMLKDVPESTAVVIDSTNKPIGMFGHRQILSHLTKKEFLNRSVGDFMDPDFALIDINQNITEVGRMLKDSGKQVAPVVEGGSLVGLISINNVIPYWWEVASVRQKRLEDNLRTTMDVVLHDLRDPLANVYGANRLLLDELMTPDEFCQQDMPGVIEHNCKSLEALISDLRMGDASKDITSGIVRRRFNLSKMIVPILKSFKNRSIEKNIGLTSDVKHGQVELYADMRRIEQIITNILSNALKYTAPGGSIHLKTNIRGRLLLITILDNGEGIPEAEVPFVFDEYCSISSQPTGGESSTGLGLSISKRLAVAHGGDISVESVVGQGSSFTISLPLPSDEILA